MSHIHLLREVFKPWLIDGVTHAQIARIIAMRAGLIPMESRQPAENVCGEEVEQEEMEIEDGVAYIPIGGVLARKTSAMERGGGVVDYADIREELSIAEQDDSVVAIVLDMDTPGGTVGGCMETADLLAGITKPVVAYTSGSIASAGYWLAAQCDRIVMTRGAQVGSIGVYCAFADISDYYKKMGVEVEVFSSGDYKGAGYPGTSLTTKQKMQMQGEVDRLFSQFKDAVLSNRAEVPEDCMDGRMFDAEQAMEYKLVDDIVTDRDDAAEIALSLA